LTQLVEGAKDRLKPEQVILWVQSKSQKP